MYWIYNYLFIPLLYLALRLASLFNAKIRKGLAGRAHLFDELSDQLKPFTSNTPRFWIHSSSMGEFEQAKPIVKALKEKYPGCFVLVSLFSPSAYEHVTSYTEADCLCYLPMDTRSNASRFIELVRPHVAVVIRHDFWLNHLSELQKRGIPSVLVNASIRKRFLYCIPPILQANRLLYAKFDWVLVISQETAQNYQNYKLGHARLEVVGDTRHDQVIRRARESGSDVAHLDAFEDERLCFVMGSTWPSDEVVLFDAIQKCLDNDCTLRYIVVPHEPHDEHLKQIETKLAGFPFVHMRLSAFEAHPKPGVDVLIVDRIGILASLYRMADITYVGGSFGPGVHNVLEPAAFGKPVLFGPRSQNSFEAGEMVRHGGGYRVDSSDEVFQLLCDFIQHPGHLKSAGEDALLFIKQNTGATERIVKRLQHLVE